MKKQRQLLYEAKREWKGLMLETQLRAYREDYGEEELNEIIGALKKAGGWVKDRVSSMFGGKTSKQKQRKEDKNKEKEKKKTHKEKYGNLENWKPTEGKKGYVKTWRQLNDVLTIARNVEELNAVNSKAKAVGAGAGKLLPLIGLVASFIGAPLTGAAATGLAAINTVKSSLGDGVLKTVANAKDARDVALNAREASDTEVEDNPLIDLFKLDDGYQEIINDGIEKKFLKFFGEYVDGQMKKNPDAQIPNEDINKFFEAFLKNEGDGIETVKDAESSVKFTEIPYNGKPDEVRHAFNKISRSVGGFIDEFI
ncbi:MAG: hypothetical protein CBD74_02300 [Saprospirales bacterium TMED214]|nr:MAG: hypothetical protein CBD74_02300 [Saprospirales bacterium TMED214]